LTQFDGPWSTVPGRLAAVPMSSVISRIEKELRDFWATPAAPGEPPKTRVCTMNLIIVSGSREIADRYTHVVDEVTASIPARAIVVALEPEAPAATLEGEATAVCQVEGHGAVCSERVRLTATGSTCARVASAVEALRVPEIPTTLVWLGRVHVDDPVFVSLAADAQRVVLDTEYTSLGSLIWQELCARFFDDPNMREHASKVTRLGLRQASEPGTRLGSEGALLLGWLATRLGWRLQRLGGATRFRRPDGGQVTMTLTAVPRPEEVAPSALAGVTIESEVNGAVTRGTIDRDLASGLPGESPDADVVVWKLEAPFPTATEQRVRLRDNRGARLLERTLHRPVSDPTLSESVAFAEPIVEDGLVCS